MAPLTLYKLDLSPPSCAVMALGDMLGLQFEFIEPDFMKKEHKSPEFKKINPLGTIPVLKDGNFTMVDSHAIAAYLVTKYGSAEQKSALYPTDLETRAVVDQRMYFDASVLFIRLKVVALPTLFAGMAGPSAQHIADIEEAYGMLEAYLDQTKYIAADHLTIADITVGSSATALQGIHALDKNKHPKTTAWIERLEKEVPSFKKIISKGAESFGNVMSLLWNKNKSN